MSQFIKGDIFVNQRRRFQLSVKETSPSIMSSLSRTLSVLMESISVHNKTKNDFGLWTTWTIALEHSIVIIIITVIMRGRNRHQNHWGKADLKTTRTQQNQRPEVQRRLELISSDHKNQGSGVHPIRTSGQNFGPGVLDYNFRYKDGAGFMVLLDL